MQSVFMGVAPALSLFGVQYYNICL